MSGVLGEHVTLVLQEKSVESLSKLSGELYEYGKLKRDMERAQETVLYHLQTVKEIRDLTKFEPDVEIRFIGSGPIESFGELEKYVASLCENHK